MSDTILERARIVFVPYRLRYLHQEVATFIHSSVYPCGSNAVFYLECVEEPKLKHQTMSRWVWTTLWYNVNVTAGDCFTQLALAASVTRNAKRYLVCVLAASSAVKCFPPQYADLLLFTLCGTWYRSRHCVPLKRWGFILTLKIANQ